MLIHIQWCTFVWSEEKLGNNVGDFFSYKINDFYQNLTVVN